VYAPGSFPTSFSYAEWLTSATDVVVLGRETARTKNDDWQPFSSFWIAFWAKVHFDPAVIASSKHVLRFRAYEMRISLTETERLTVVRRSGISRWQNTAVWYSMRVHRCSRRCRMGTSVRESMSYDSDANGVVRCDKKTEMLFCC